MQRLTRTIALCVAAAFSMTLSERLWAQQVAPKIHTLTVYDSFDQKLINPAKWSSDWQCGPAATECVSEIVNGKLHLRLRAYGGTGTNIGAQFGSAQLYLKAASLATVVAAGVMVRSTSAADCPTNPNAGSHGQALLDGVFFNDGGGTPAGDVHAFLQLDRYASEATGVVPVGGFLQYQGNFFGNVDVGVVNVGERAIVQLTWDRPNHRFILRLIRPTQNTISEQYMPYTMPDSAPAVTPFRRLGVFGFPPNCVGTQTFAEMDILVDNVTVGQ